MRMSSKNLRTGVQGNVSSQLIEREIDELSQALLNLACEKIREMMLTFYTQFCMLSGILEVENRLQG